GRPRPAARGSASGRRDGPAPRRARSCQRLAQPFHEGVLGDLELLAAAQVLDRHRVARGLVAAADERKADARTVGVLQLLRQLARLELGLDLEAGGAQ